MNTLNKFGSTIPHVVLALVILIILSACSALKMVYPRLDWIIPHYVDDYISLNDIQQEEFDGKLQSLLDWHCHKPVNQYATWLNRIKEDFEYNLITREKILTHVNKTGYFWQDLAEQTVPKLVPILASASQAQIEQLFEHFEETNIEHQQEYVDISYADLRQKLADRMQDRFENWIGDLSQDQKDAIHRWSFEATKRNTGWLESRLRWQAALQAIFSAKLDKPQLAKALNKFFLNPKNLWTEKYRSERAASRREVNQLMFLTYQTFLPRQRKYIISQLGGWSEEIASLSCNAKRT